MPVHGRSALFRGKFKAALTTAGFLAHVALQVWQKGGVTHGQPAGTGSEGITSLAPSIRRIAITNNRLETLADGHVTCRFQGAGRTTGQQRTLPAEACMRRFLPPGRPRGCINVRSYGVLSPGRRQALTQSRMRLATCPHNDHTAPSGPTGA